jgi:hypothetical protein
MGKKVARGTCVACLDSYPETDLFEIIFHNRDKETVRQVYLCMPCTAAISNARGRQIQIESANAKAGARAPARMRP